MFGMDIFFQKESFTFREEAKLIDNSVYLLIKKLLGSMVGMMDHLAEIAGSFVASLLVIEEPQKP